MVSMRRTLLALLTVTASGLVSAQVNDVARVGNDIRNSTSGIRWQGTTFLLNGDPFYQPEGVLFAFAAYFRNNKPMKFQVWEPMDIANARYKLKAEWLVNPTVTRGRQDIFLYAEQKDCIYFERGFRIGVYTPEVPGSVAYTFNSSVPEALQHIADPNNAPAVGDTVTFDGLTYPYKFSAAAYIDTDVASYTNPRNPECPRDRRIPRDSAFPRNIPGATGSTGPQGVAGKDGATGATGPMGATGAPGQNGIDGVPGREGEKGPQGATGMQGPIGATGAQGPRGEKGENGVAGPAGPKGPAGPVGPKQASQIDSEVGECEWCWKLLNPYLILGVLIWLAVVSVLLLIVCGVVCCRCCRRGNNSSSSSRQHHYSNGSVTGWNHKDLWKTTYDEVETGSKPGYDNPAMDNSYYVEEGRTAF